jgi:hypothetical protein
MRRLLFHVTDICAALVLLTLMMAPASSAAESSRGRNSLDQGGESCESAFPIPSVPYNDTGISGVVEDCPGPPFWDVFYQFIAPVSGQYIASTCGSPSHMTVTAWTGGSCCFPGVPIPANAVCDGDPFVNAALFIPLNAGDVVFFELGSASPSAPPDQPYNFELTGPPGGNPSISVNSSDVEFPPTHLQATAVQTVQVSNVGGANLSVSVNPSGSIWTVNPPSLVLTPGETQPVTIAFSPTFEHTFVGTIEFDSNDPLHPRDSVRVAGDGCPTAVAPPAPLLLPAASPTATYVSIPWDGNGQSTQYEVEYSSDNFTTSSFALFVEGNNTASYFETAGRWGFEGTGAITGLNPGSTYQVRLHARDCTGLDVIGPPSSLTTPPDITVPIRSDSLVIQLVAPDSLQLSWSQPRTGGPLWEVTDYLVRFHSSVSDSGHVVAITPERGIRIPLPAVSLGFYTVEPLLTGNYDQPSPFIAWPPDGAVISGRNSIVIDDYLHAAQWDSFRVAIGSVPVGSNLNNAWGETGKRAISVDFAALGTGPMHITATVVDRSGRTFTNAINVMVEALPHASFTPEYSATSQTVSADTAGYVPPSVGGIVDFLWEGSLIDERYGHAISFPWETSFDSLVVLHCTPIPSIKMLTESPNWFTDADEKAGVKPVVEDPAVPFSEIACCCDNLELRTTGTCNGVYGSQKNVPLGPIMRCDPDTREYTIGYAFEVEVTIKYKLAHMSSDCSWGQNCKRTSIYEVGTCDNLGGFVPSNPAESDTSYKTFNGTRYSRDGADWGNDDYRPENHGATQDQSQQIKGKIRWHDWPARQDTRPLNRAIRDHRRAIFSARVDPQCMPVNIICCQTWELEWDVTICPGCDVHQTIAPHIFNNVTPQDCPALAN